MPGNLPSIHDLLQKKSVVNTPVPSSHSITQNPFVASTPAPLTTNTPTTPPSGIVLTDDETSKKFQDKMHAIAVREKEMEASRQAQSLHLPFIILKGFPISPDALTLILEEQARQSKTLCFLFNGSELRLGTTQPNDPRVKELQYELEERHKANVVVYVISEESLQYGLKLYDNLPKIKPIIKGVQITEEEIAKYQERMTNFTSIAQALEHANATDVIAVIIAASLKLESSDIHIEAEEHGIAVRFRIDGILQDVANLEREQWKRIINRLKLIASLKINVNDQAQDGRFTIYQKHTELDVRTSTIPTAFGESVAMRLLNPELITIEWTALGFRPAALKKLQKEIDKPNGMIVTTGPTGSGKTTTLYAILRRLNTPGVKIITLEDPIEYKVQGINQSQIDTHKEYTFAKGLRSILRQDPDIVMVGEIRDLETAEIAVQAALTGHLLLSTIHTNDAAGAIPRFLSMGLAPHLLAPALNAILGQRLLRRLCSCKKPITIEADLLALVKAQFDAIPPTSGESPIDPATVTFYGAQGCEFCHHTGYKGRIGAYEILLKTLDVEKAMLEQGVISEYRMRELAALQGMVTMTQDALLKASEGLTSIDEIQRIFGL